MRTHTLTADDVAARLMSLDRPGYCARMAAGILLTPNGPNRVLAHEAADFIRVADQGPMAVDWIGLRNALDAGTLALEPRAAQLLRIASVLALL